MIAVYVFVHVAIINNKDKIDTSL